MGDIRYSRCPGRFLRPCGNEMRKRFELDRKGGGESVGGSKSCEGCLTDSIDLSSAVRPTWVSQFPSVNELREREAEGDQSLVHEAAVLSRYR